MKPSPPLVHLIVFARSGQTWLPAARLDANGGKAIAPFTAKWTGDIRLALGHPNFKLDGLRVEVAVPLRNYSYSVVPDCGRHYVNTSKGLDIRSGAFGVHAANAGHPFFALSDEAGKFWFAFGILNAAGEVRCRRVLPRISSRKAMVGGDDLLALSFEWDTSDWQVDFFATGREKTWFHALRRYTTGIREAEQLQYPQQDEVWEPAWCNWTAFSSDDMTGPRLVENARIAYDLGIRAVTIDDGWFGPGLDSEMELNFGDYRPDPKKFSDLPATVREIQQIGHRVLLWHAPLCVARTSPVWPKLQRWAMHVDGQEFTSVNGLQQLCPACPEVRAYVQSETERMLRDYGVDGLKVDLYNCLPTRRCDSKHHAHDVADPVMAVDATMEAQWAAARRVKPDVIFELKQDYGNARLCRHGSMVRAGDTAYDVNTNLRRCFYVQAYAQAVLNDYFVSDAFISPHALRLAMIRMLTAGVPAFGNDMTRLTAAQRKVIREWLDFYRQELPMFREKREPQDNSLGVWQGGNRQRAWVSAWADAREIKLPAAKTVFVMNATAHDELYVRLPGKKVVRLPVPSGGRVVLES